MHHKSVNETPRANISDQTLTDESMSQINDQKDSFDDDSLSEILSVKSFQNNIEETIDKYSNSTHHSSSSSSSIQSSSSEQQSFDSKDTSDTSSSGNSHKLSLLGITNKKKKSRKKNSTKKAKKSKFLSSDKVCYHALNMIKFLGTLHMKKLDLKYEPRLRRAAFIEWISQLEMAFFSNKYTKKVLKDYSTKNKINRSDSKMTDLLIYTVAYAFMDNATRMSNINYKTKVQNF